MTAIPVFLHLGRGMLVCFHTKISSITPVSELYREGYWHGRGALGGSSRRGSDSRPYGVLA